MQCVANKERVVAREEEAQRMSKDDLAILRKALEMPITQVPLKMTFIVKTTEAERTYEQQRMNIMTLSQLFSQYAEKTVPLAMQLYGPQGQAMQQQAPELFNYMGRLLTGSGKLMESIFGFFGVQDTQNYVPDTEKMDKMLDMMQGALAAMQNMPQVGVAKQQAQAQTQPQAPQLPIGKEQQGTAGAPGMY